MKYLGNSGFELTEWSSNASQIIKTFPESELSPNHKNLDLIEPTIERVLGVLCNSEKDVIQIKVVQKPFQATKRKILSYVSSIFDPLGLLTPVLLRPKLIIQNLWRLKLDLDTPIPTELENLWLLWKENVSEFSKIEIPR